MNKRENLNGPIAVWYLITLLLCIFTLTMLFLIQGLNKLYYAVVSLLAVLQFAGLFYYLQEDRAPAKKSLRIVLRLNLLCSLGAVFAAVFFFLMMYSQFHRTITADAEGDFSDIDMQAVMNAENCYVYKTDDLYIIFPQYSRIEFHFQTRPPKSDESITYLGSAAFFDRDEFGFRHDNLIGDHVKDGVLYEGLPKKGINAFSFYDGEAHFTKGDPDAAMQTAAEHGGDGFEQFIVIWEKKLEPFISPKLRCYRVVAEYEGRLCVIDSIYPETYSNFIYSVQKLGVETALYNDMGSKMSYSWIRTDDGSIENLFGTPSPLAHCWLSFNK